MLYTLDGELHEDGAPALGPGDRGLTLGDGAFETMAVRGGRAMRLDDHLDRLAEGLRILAFSTPPERRALGEAVARVVAANALEQGVIRLTVTRGAGARGVSIAGCDSPRVLVTAAAGLPEMAPVEAVVCREVRRNDLSPTSRVKSLSYLDSVLARREAETRGAREGLLLNTRGRLAEASIANVFVVNRRRLRTPPLSEGALPGVARKVLLEALDAWEEPIEAAELETAEEVFLTNSLGVRPVTAIDGRSLPAGARGSATAAAQAAYARAFGVD